MARIALNNDEPPQPMAVILTEEDGSRAVRGFTQEASQGDSALGHASQPSDLTTREWLKAYAVAVAIVLVAYLVALEFLLADCSVRDLVCAPQQPFKVGSDISLFAGLFVLALAVERLLEPWSRWIGPNTEKAKDERDAAKVEAKKDSQDPAKLEAFAAAQSKVDKSRQNQRS